MPHPFDLTPDFVIALDPCWDVHRVRAAFGDRPSVRLSEAVADPSLDTDHAIWLGCRALWEIDRTAARRFAVVVARWASIRFGDRETIETPNGPRWQGRPTPTTRVTWRHIHDMATDEDLDAARAAAWVATRDAARDAARAATRAAAWAAARDAAWAAARDATRAAAWAAANAAAWDAAWDAANAAAWAAANAAAWDAIRKHLVRMIRRAEGARQAAR
jgi:hypothetical protein